MIHELSILIPTRNDVCLQQVSALQQMASGIDGLRYEIIVSDDASTDEESLRLNAKINQIDRCKLLQRTENTGRAANRNFLARQAHFEWLLFLDCNVGIPNERFLRNYLETSESDVVNGGIFAKTDKSLSNNNLRYMYEKKIEAAHTASERNKRPYQSFRTSNFMVRRSVMLSHPLDESVPGYGYEDVLFGKILCDNKIHILHIDNPVVITQFENNEQYVAKVEEAMRTLHALQDNLANYSPLLAAAEKLRKTGLTNAFRRFFNAKSDAIRANLTSTSPSIKWLNVYKLGYFLSLNDTHA